MQTARDELQYMGYSIRTESYRFTTWLKWGGATLKGIWVSFISKRRFFDIK